MDSRQKNWHSTRKYSEEQLQVARIVLAEITNGAPTMKAIRSHPLMKGGYISKHALVHAYRGLVLSGEITENIDLLARIRMKPIRSLSGVSTVTVLTEPHPCPGECLFCPQEIGLPKSYLKDEPGAARAYQNHFDPYKQVISRLESYYAIGHPFDKIELLILGGSWSAYPLEYREQFIKRCLDAMNGKDAGTLSEAQHWNESAASRNVGLVVETRPDMITPQEIAHMRLLGVTKVQMGAQSFDDDILKKNCRGHSVADTLNACALLRSAGFKIVLHWMPNLLGATPQSDQEDFKQMWAGGFCPDELKIYPTQLVKEAPLYALWQQGQYHPYSTEQLVDLIAGLKPSIPSYCRVNRIVRDIPSNYIVAGSKRSSLRQDVQRMLAERGEHCRCVRCREIRGQAVDLKDLKLSDHIYHPADAEEHFISYDSPDDRLAGYLRLSFPKPAEPGVRQTNREELFKEIPVLSGAALVREVHVYGQSIAVGEEIEGAAQHTGLGTSLLERAAKLARESGFSSLAVISAIGTRLYYEKRGFKRAGLYMVMDLM
jgi:elongator complex protein 3